MTDIGKPTMNKPAMIRDGSLQNFKGDVIDASQSALVLVDFWAPWCQPCRALTPILERLVTGYQGKLSLVKINADQEKMLVQQLQVQSLPTVLAFYKGQPVNGFQGALPEPKIKAFIDQLLATTVDAADPGKEMLKQIHAQAFAMLDAREYDQAEPLLRSGIKIDPSNPKTLAGLALLMIGHNKLDEAQKILSNIPSDVDDPDVARAKAALDLGMESVESGPETVDTLVETVTHNPEDFDSRFKLASLYIASRNYEEAADHLFAILTQDQGWNDGAAHQTLLKLFAAQGQDSVFTIHNRRRLSAILFA